MAVCHGLVTLPSKALSKRCANQLPSGASLLNAMLLKPASFGGQFVQRNIASRVVLDQLHLLGQSFTTSALLGRPN